jgi:membrane protein YqaA with SNARE-associated domain
VSLVSVGELQQLVSAHGYWAVALIVGLESMGLPLPGETILVLAAIYAAAEPNFNVWVVIAVAAFGAIVGDNAGYWLGLRYGYALLLRYGERFGMFEARNKLSQYLYLKHGAKVVFLGRFVALLRKRHLFTPTDALVRTMQAEQAGQAFRVLPDGHGSPTPQPHACSLRIIALDGAKQKAALVQT